MRAMFTQRLLCRSPLLLAVAALLPACSGKDGESWIDQTSAAMVTDSPVFINEVHYDNVGTDSGEAIEVAGPAGTSLEGWSLVLYNGSANVRAPYETVALSGTLPDEGVGFGALAVAFASNGIQNGSPDAVALVAPDGTVAQFLSYEGSFEALTGPAAGLTSTDIGVAQTSDTPLGSSLQLTGTGSLYRDFAWIADVPASFGAINVGQLFQGAPVEAAPRLVGSVPADGTRGIPVDGSIELQFSEPVTVAKGGFVLICSTDREVALDVSGAETSYTVTPRTPLRAGEHCTLTVRAAAVTDSDDNDPPDAMARDQSLWFHVRREARIFEIQGRAHVSPLVGEFVSAVPGIVTAVDGSGFYLQDPQGDGDASTSDGIFVFTGGAPAVVPGDVVRVSGSVAEFRPGCSNCSPTSSGYANLSTTELVDVTELEIVARGQLLPEPTRIGRHGRTPPRQIIDNDSSGDVEDSKATWFDPWQDGIDFYESLEGMRVGVADAVAVGPTNRFGEVVVLADRGRTAQRRTARGGIVVQPHDFNPERLLVDDVLVPNPPQVDVGAVFTQPIVGVMSYSFGNFKLLNTEPLLASPSPLERERTSFGPIGPGELDVATFNVENLSSRDPQEKFEALADLIVDHLGSPDLLGLEEVQDDSGPRNDGVVSANVTLSRLIDAIAAAGGPTYEARQIDPLNNADGGQPGGNIRVAFLFRSDRGLTFVDRPGGTATAATDVVIGSDGRPELTLSPGRVTPEDAAFEDSRKPLVGELEFAGEKLFVVVNHWSSKGGDAPLFGRFQPPPLTSEEQRLAQARVVAAFVGELRAVDPRARVLVLGDLNDFPFSPPLQVLGKSGLLNLYQNQPVSERYSYVFDGNSQALDHILVSHELLGRARLDVVHVNAEFTERASDHDPLLARLRLR